jgi:hypothetical protein
MVNASNIREIHSSSETLQERAGGSDAEVRRLKRVVAEALRVLAPELNAPTVDAESRNVFTHLDRILRTP